MRILILHLHDQNFQMGGADRGVLDLSSALAPLYEDEVRLLVNSGPLAEEAAKRGLSVVLIPRSRLAFLKTVQIIKQQMRSFRPDICHSHHRFTTFLLDLFLKNQGIPILHTQRIQTRSRRFLFRYGNFMTTVSECLRRHMVQYYGVSEKKVRAIVNAVAPSKLNPDALSELKQKFTRRPDELFALCVGRFHEQKGHVYLIDAVEQLSESHRKKIRIFLAGDGPLEDSLRQRIEQKHLQENFVFLGYFKEIPTALEFCDFLILPSLWEGLPRVVLEGFALGKPALATDIPGTSDVVIHSQNGLLVPPRDPSALAGALRLILDSPAALSKMQQGARDAAKKYSFEQMVQNYHTLYQELKKEQ
jgi:glycosyltransferase involved in cell wall biosynthesis